MECPYCNAKMEEGKLKQDRYALKWKSNERRSKNVKLTSFLTQTYVGDVIKLLLILIRRYNYISEVYIDKKKQWQQKNDFYLIETVLSLPLNFFI